MLNERFQNIKIFLFLLLLFSLNIVSAGYSVYSGYSPNANLPPEIREIEGEDTRYLVIPRDTAKYQGIFFDRILDLSGATSGNKITFTMKSPKLNYTCFIYFQHGDTIFRSFYVPKSGTKIDIVLDLDLKNWKSTKPNPKFGKVKRILIQSVDFRKPHQMEISDIKFDAPDADKEIILIPRKAEPVFTAETIPEDWKGIGANWFKGGPEVMNGRIDLEVSWSSLENRYSGIECKFRFTGNNPYSNYWVYFRPMDQVLTMEKQLNNKLLPEIKKNISHLNYPQKWIPDKKYKLQIEFVGTEIKVWLDGRFCFIAKDVKAPFDTGIFCLAVSQGGTIHSIKIYSYDDKKELRTGNFEYSVPPEYGHVNSDKQAHWGLRSNGEPEIIFDLEKIRFVKEISISSEADPSQNFSSVIVWAGNNKKDWKAVASIPNDRVERHKLRYSLNGRIDTAARYYRLTFQRSKYDNAIEVGNVDFFYSDDLPSLAETKKKKSFIRPQGLPEADFSNGDANNYFFKSPLFSMAFSKKNGAITGIINDSTLQITGSYDTYFCENLKGHFSASELFDQVTEIDKKGNTIILKAENPRLPGIVIIKEYSISDDERRFSKKITFINERNDNANDLFVTVQTKTLLNPEYREDGFYFGADWGFGGRLKASEVLFDMANIPHCPGNSKIGFFVNPSSRSNIGQYLFKVNDRYVSGTITLWFEKENIPLTYTVDGWKFGMATLQLKPGEPTSLEYNFHRFEGRDLEFYQAYRKIPEVAERYQEFSPVKWLSDFKCSIPGSMYHTTIEQLGLFDNDGYITALHCGPNRWGDWVGKGVVNTSTGDMEPCESVAKEFSLIRQRFPFAKVGLYTWAWCGMPHSDAYKKHPEWFFTRTKAGKVWSAYGSGTVTNFLRHIGLPDSSEKLLSGADEIMENLKSDFFYLDGGNGGTNVIDWKNLRVSQIYDWDEFHTNLKRTVRNSGDDKPLYFNCHSEWCYDLGVHEGIQSRFTKKLWRDSADALYVTKLKQKLDPLRKVLPLYWNDIAAQYYANYCIGMGLPPVVWDGIVPRISYISAAYENRNLELLNGKYLPDWRFNTETVTEAYTFKNGKTPVFSVIDHNTIAAPVSIEIDRESIGLNTDSNLFVWRFTLNDIMPKLKTKYGLPEWMKKEIYQKFNFSCDMAASGGFHAVVSAGKSYKDNIRFKPETLEYLVLAEGPATIYSVNGLRTNFFQPDSGRFSLESSLHNDEIKITQTGSGKIESIVFIPTEWDGVKVENAVLKHLFFHKGIQYAVVKLNESETANLMPVSKLSKRQFIEGGRLSFRFNSTELRMEPSGKKGIVRIIAPDGSVAYVRDISPSEEVRIVLPPQLSDGKYEVIRDDMEGENVVSYRGSFKISNHYRYYPPAEKFIRGKIREKKTPIVTVTPVNKTVKGKKLLRIGTESHDGYDGTAFVSVDLDKLAVEVGTNAFPPTYSGAEEFSFAGFEFESIRHVKLRAKSNMLDVFCENEQGVFPYQTVNSFGGLMVDYHTKAGYTKRVAFSLGMIAKKRSVSRPRFGRAAKPDLFCILDNLIANGREKEYTLDLKEWAPEDWDEKAWIIIGTDRASSGRHLGMEILDFPEQAVQGTRIKNLDVKPLDIRLSPKQQSIVIDGKISSVEWKNAVQIKNLYALLTMEDCPEKTDIFLGMDQHFFYIGIILHESAREFVTHNKDPFIWKNDAVDIGIGLADGTQHQIIIDAAGQTFQLDTRNAKTAGVQQKIWKLKTGTGIRRKQCFIEIAIRREDISANSNGKLKFNLARYRATEKKSVEIYTISPIAKYSLMDPALFNNLIWK